MANADAMQQIFDAARRDFEKKLPANFPFRDILAIDTISKMWEAVDKLQQDQMRRSDLRNMNRIKLFLDRLERYAGVIEVLIQVKPDILALIWGPIKLLLQWAVDWREGFDAIVKTMESIGDLLPEFGEVVQPFLDNEHIGIVLGLLYQDILDFYFEALKFFCLSRRRLLFEALWPTRRDRIKVVESNIKNHARLLSENITLEHIRRVEDDRIKSIDRFRKSEEAHLKQEFLALETHVSPPSYDKRVQETFARACRGSADWLIQDAVFERWVDVSSRGTGLLWLQGIPGAGKTFLASLVVDEAKKHGRVLYAFPTHDQNTNSSSRTAISILQSLLFQLSSGEVDLMGLVVDNSQGLKSGLAVIEDLLVKLLNCAGPTYLVVDGVDEVEEFERKQILHSLLQVQSVFGEPTLRICISSRGEDDIANILGASATTVRVDQRNYPAIYTYVKGRFDDWMASTDFLPEGQSEIKALLLPVSVKAKGMFLYARVVIDNVVDLLSIEEIRAELRALPEDLDDAYGRILSRIKRLSSRKQAAAKKILGWIGCSTTPLKIYELEQAVLVGSVSHDDAPLVDSSLNIVKLCGPIVEVVNEIPKFVHFTVHEYIFSQKIGFLSIVESTMELLVTCIFYLCFNSLRDEIEEDQLRENLIVGRYRLQVFASSNWFPLALRYVVLTLDNKDFSAVNGLMENLFFELKNSEFQREAEPGDGTVTKQSSEVLPWPEAPKFLCYVRKFYKDCPKTSWRLPDAKNWSCYDPLIVSSCSARVETLYNKLLCAGYHHDRLPNPDLTGGSSNSEGTGNCSCSKLKRHYGKFLYKCDYFACNYRREGFETLEELRLHTNNHTRPYKCLAQGCDFAEIGFCTVANLVEHQKKFHRAVREGSGMNPAMLDEDALYPVFFEHVRDDNMVELQMLWHQWNQKLRNTYKAELLVMAAGKGSLPAVEMFLEWDDQQNRPANDNVKFGAVIYEAVQSGNLDLVRWILRKSADWGRVGSGRYREILVSVLKSDSLDMLDICLDILVSLGEGIKGYISNELFEKTVFNTARKFPKMEARMVEGWRRLTISGKLGPPELGRALIMVAQTTYSIEHAKVLLELGASIDYPYFPGNGRAKTALQWACRRSSMDAAVFVRFLLLEGASTVKYFGHIPPEMEEGASKIEDWLGMNWDELVEWAEQQRDNTGKGGRADSEDGE